MVSAYTRRGAEVTIKALEAGAFDFVAKPSGPSQDANVAALSEDLLAKIRVCARRQRRSALTPGEAPRPVAPSAVAPRIPQRPSAIRAIVIGASTGGPRVLSTILPELCGLTDLPILVVQHMPPDFTRSLAESLARQTGRPVAEATDGAAVERGTVLIATRWQTSPASRFARRTRCWSDRSTAGKRLPAVGRCSFPVGCRDSA